MKKGLVWLLSAFLFLITSPVFALYDISKTGQQTSYLGSDDGNLELGQEIPTPRFIDNDDGTITDELTGLIWIKDNYCANQFISGASSNKWQDAFSFVNALNNKTLVEPCEGYEWQFNDWRVPNIRELQSLVKYGMDNDTSILTWLLLPGNESTGFTNTTLAVNPIWSSSTDASVTENAWAINLDNGQILSLNKSGN
ncbi:MAG: DUF1566 domain-containing protein, partial [Gammaproteobacteria bacterium]|nr:DUF1566 domain-containing protein [Gammaproteobacteria bacterium]